MLVAVNPAQLLVCIPIANRTMPEFEKGVEELVRGGEFPQLDVLQSDRETSVFSMTFQNRIYEKYGVKIQFLKRLSKAFLSERAIYTVKSR